MKDRYVEVLPLPSVSAGTRLRVERDARDDRYPLIELAIEQVLPEQVNNPDARHIRRGTVVTMADVDVGWVHDRLGEVRALVDGVAVTDRVRRLIDVYGAACASAAIAEELGPDQQHDADRNEEAALQKLVGCVTNLESEIEARTVARIVAWLRANGSVNDAVADVIEHGEWKSVSPSTCTGITARWCPRCGDCTCDPDPAELVKVDCPLHRPNSEHGE